MSISSVGLGAVAPLVHKIQGPSPLAKAADGDHKVASAQTSSVKDSDGDYKLLPAAQAAAKSSAAVQQALTNLKKGG